MRVVELYYAISGRSFASKEGRGKEEDRSKRANEMKLSPREVDHLVLAQVGLLAQRRLARGTRLSYPEAIALIAYVVMEKARDGQMSVSELMDFGSRLLGKANRN